MSPKVYSYRRFSSGRQAAGHSLQRQVESARRWCYENGYELDESLALADLGISAYKGDNASRGALAGFLTAIESNKVPKGSILLVESLDRLSRAALPEAVGLLTQIVRAGIRVVSLIDGKEWNEKTIEDTMNFMVSVILFSRAHEESSTKAKRVSDAFQRKRKANQPVVSIMHGPGWVIPKEDRSGWLIDEVKATSVKQVFLLAADGHGGVSIARKANVEAWPLPWRKRKNTTGLWEHTAISRLLHDRRVLGEWQPKRVVAGRLVHDGDPVQGYFPAIIDEELWHKAQIAVSGRPGPKRIRGVKADIFSGLLYCKCGEKMERKAASERGTARYYCNARKKGLTDCPSISEQVLLSYVLKNVAQAEQQAFRSGDEASRLHAELQIAESKIEDINARAARVLTALEDAGSSPMILDRLRAIEEEKDKVAKQVIELKEALEHINYLPLEFGEDLAEQAASIVKNKDAIEARHKLAISLNSVLKKIVWSGGFFMIYLRNGHGLGIPIPKKMLKPFARLKTKGG